MTLLDMSQNRYWIDWVLEGTCIKQPLKKYASIYNMPDEYLLLLFLTAYSVALPKNFTYNYNLDNLDYQAIPSIFTLIIGEVGVGKSTVIKSLELPGNFFVENITFSELREDSINNQTGFLVYANTLESFIIHLSDESEKTKLEKLTKVWDGANVSICRATDCFQVSLLSEMVTSFFKDYFSNEKIDKTNIISRFLILPIESFSIPFFRVSDTDLKEFQTTFSELFERTQNALITLEKPFRIQSSQDENITQLLHSLNKQQEKRANSIKNLNKGFYQWLRRNAEYTARIALVIHTLRFIEGLESELEVMSVGSMERAVAISKWLTQKAEIVFTL